MSEHDEQEAIFDLYYDVLSSVAQRNPLLCWAHVRAVTCAILRERYGVEIPW